MNGIWAELRSHWLLTAILVSCVGIEAVLLAADYGLMGDMRLRGLVYEYCGFWTGILRGWQPNYAAQPYLMFVTYAFLHAGPMHLTVNMITLWSMGRAVRGRVGTAGLGLLYAGSALGGAGGYALLGTNLTPMVGASGALFGLVGGLLAWNYVDRYTFAEGLWPIARAALLLIALNLVMWWAMNGLMAWQTHLGGFVAGWVMALLIDPRGREAI